MKAISTLLTVLAMLITITAAIALVWLQVDGVFPSDEMGSSYRWQVAMLPLMVMGVGLVLIAVAQILRIVAARFEAATVPVV